MKMYLRMILIIVSGLLVPLSFLPYGFWPLIIISLALMLPSVTDTAPRKAFYLGMLQGMLGYGISLYWMFYIFRSVAIPLYAMMAFFSALFCLVFNLVSKHINSAFLKVLAASILWTALEFYRSELFFLRFPWITPGTAIGPTWLSPLIGVYGASFLLMGTAASFAFRKTLWLGAILLAGVMFLGLYRPSVVDPPPDDKGVKVVVVQGELCSMDEYAQLTRTVTNPSPDLVVWPEYALPYDIRKHHYKFDKFKNICHEIDAVFVVGTQTKTGTSVNDWYNTALISDKNGVIGEYYKARPVHLFNDGIAGKDFNPVHTPVGRIATPICFDCDYTAVVRAMTKNGAEFFAVPSFDNTFWSETQHLQHSIFFRLRAAENARWLACSASSGISQIIDPHGNVHKSIPVMEKGAIIGNIGRSKGLNFFVRIGWFFPWITIAASALLLIWLLYKHYTTYEPQHTL